LRSRAQSKLGAGSVLRPLGTATSLCPRLFTSE
jgi:hypothetical protein